MTDARELDPKRKPAIDAVFENLPDSYPDIRFQLNAISTAVREKMARLLEPHLNASVANQKLANDLNEARMLADSIDSNLCHLGLCAAVNGKPALLIAERGEDIGDYKYSVLVRTDEKPWFTRTLVSGTIPHLSLMPAPMNFEHYIGPLRKHATAYMRAR